MTTNQTTTNLSRAVLITGCSTGIGRATAVMLAAKGWPVYATARKLEAIRDLEAKGCKTLALDVCDENSMRAAVQAVEQAHGAVGVLVNNAGYGLEGCFEETPMEEVRRQFETNVFGLTRMCQLVLPGMRKQRWGRIVNLSSVGGKLTLPGGAFYHATKHAVEALSDAMRFELRDFGIDVVIIEPGPIKTEFGNTAIAAVGRVKQAESDQIVAAMKKKQLPVAYVLYPDEGHGFARPQNRLAFYAIAEGFLAKCIGGRQEGIGNDFDGSSLQVPEGAAIVPGLQEALAKQAEAPGARSKQ